MNPKDMQVFRQGIEKHFSGKVDINKLNRELHALNEVVLDLGESAEKSIKSLKAEFELYRFGFDAEIKHEIEKRFNEMSEEHETKINQVKQHHDTAICNIREEIHKTCQATQELPTNTTQSEKYIIGRLSSLERRLTDQSCELIGKISTEINDMTQEMSCHKLELIKLPEIESQLLDLDQKFMLNNSMLEQMKTKFCTLNEILAKITTLTNGYESLTRRVKCIDEIILSHENLVPKIKAIEDSICMMNNEQSTLREKIEELNGLKQLSEILSKNTSKNSSAISKIQGDLLNLTNTVTVFSEKVLVLNERLESINIQLQEYKYLPGLIHDVETKLLETQSQIIGKLAILQIKNQENHTLLSDFMVEINTFKTVITEKIEANHEKIEKLSALTEELRGVPAILENLESRVIENHAHVESKLSSIQNKLHDDHSKITQLDIAIDEIKEGFNSHGFKICRLIEAQEKYRGIEEKLEALIDNGVLQGSKIHENSEKIETLQYEFKRYRTDVGQLEEQLREFRESVNERFHEKSRDGRLDQIENRLDKVEGDTEKHKKSVSEIRESLESFEGHRSELLESRKSLLSECRESLQSHRSELSESHRSLTSEFRESLENHRLDLSEHKKSLTIEVQQLINDQKSTRSWIEDYLEKYNRSSTTYQSSTSQKLTDLTEQLTDLTGKVNKLQNELNESQDREDPNRDSNVIIERIQRLEDRADRRQSGTENSSSTDTDTAEDERYIELTRRLEELIQQSTIKVNYENDGETHRYVGNRGKLEILPGVNAMTGRSDPEMNGFRSDRGVQFSFSGQVNVPSLKSYGAVDVDLLVAKNIKLSGTLAGIPVSQLRGEPVLNVSLQVHANSSYKIDTDKLIKHIEVKDSNGWSIPIGRESYVWRYVSGKVEIRTGSYPLGNSEEGTRGPYNIFLF